MKSLIFLAALVTLSLSALFSVPDLTIAKDATGNLIVKGPLIPATGYTGVAPYGLCPAFDVVASAFSQQFILLSCPITKTAKATGYYNWKGVTNENTTIKSICAGTSINY